MNGACYRLTGVSPLRNGVLVWDVRGYMILACHGLFQQVWFGGEIYGIMSEI